MFPKNKFVDRRELTSWLQKNVNENELIFDKCADIFDIIMKKLEDKNIHLCVDNNIFMIKLCKFLCENSSC